MKKFVRRSSFILIIVASMIISSCGKKAQENQNQPVDTTKVAKQVDTSAVKAADTTKAKTEVKKEAEKPATQEALKGTWSGKFDSRDAVLKITSVKGNNFSGSITIQYREVVNQQVSGTINPAKLSISMRDQLHSKQMGTYAAKVTSDMKSMSGTFTTSLDKIKASFNLKKK